MDGDVDFVELVEFLGGFIGDILLPKFKKTNLLLECQRQTSTIFIPIIPTRPTGPTPSLNLLHTEKTLSYTKPRLNRIFRKCSMNLSV